MADDFGALPRNLQLQIDAVFDDQTASQSIRLPFKKRRKLNEPDAAGGFLAHSGDAEEERIPSEDDVIPLSLIPTALQALDLPPDDEEVLRVFHNAAGGWNGDPMADKPNDTVDEERAVSRKDWRAVCAVVVGSREGDIDEIGDTGGGFFIEDRPDATSPAEQSPREDGEGEDTGEDAYEEPASEPSSLSSFSDPGDDSDSDSYMTGPSKSKSKSNVKSKPAQMRSSAPGAPTPRQRRTCLEAYALFFPPNPSLSEEVLTTKRLTYKDIVRVTDLLKERVKADEITEMLSLFSTSPDASMGFEDFMRMMIQAKLA